MNVDRENLYSILYQYFCIGDSYTYELTRVKEAFSYGTVTIEDFEEWCSDNIKDLTNYIINCLTSDPSAPSSALPSSGDSEEAAPTAKGG